MPVQSALGGDPRLVLNVAGRLYAIAHGERTHICTVGWYHHYRSGRIIDNHSAFGSVRYLLYFAPNGHRCPIEALRIVRDLPDLVLSGLTPAAATSQQRDSPRSEALKQFPSLHGSH
jgi:hypothetical protein